MFLRHPRYPFVQAVVFRVEKDADPSDAEPSM
jgi:hypothetical protein